MFGEHFLMNSAFIEGMFTSATADGHTGDGDIRTRWIEFHARAAGSGKNAAPVRVGAGESGFH